MLKINVSLLKKMPLNQKNEKKNYSKSKLWALVLFILKEIFIRLRVFFKIHVYLQPKKHIP